MNFTKEFLSHLARARALVAQKRFNQAEQLYGQLLETGEGREGLLREIFQLHMQQKELAKASVCLHQLANEFPAKPGYWLRVAELAQSMGDLDKAIGAYRSFLQRLPDRPDNIYNFARLLKGAGHLEEALEQYRKALSKNISHPEEVYTNIGVICSELRQEQEARQSFGKALDINPNYIPALVNLAGLLEEEGDRESVADYYRKVLSIDGNYSLALSRLAYLHRAHSAEDPLIQQISSQFVRQGIPPEELEELNFALGKLLDNCGSYDRAFSSYKAANELGIRRLAPYSRAGHTELVDRLIQVFSPDWFSGERRGLPDTPVFICGMFRSGSTLVEQIVSGHHQVTGGGELEFFPALVAAMGEHYPQAIKDKGSDFFRRNGGDYLSYLKRRFPSEDIVTDKRPDNFLHIGLIKSIFPGARIIWTRRAFLDNCLSIYFQQLGGGMNYSADLDSIGHYCVEQLRLMEHWKGLFPDSIIEVNYEKLVAEPEAETRGLLRFLQLPWDPACMNFIERKNYVKTASIWQVREGIHRGSVGRYRHYQSHLGVLEKYLSDLLLEKQP
ncbi:tetratricopeptide repeat-containing sulfotransferase family protein [Microbulbifer sp. 2201CG32-9]|uniref:tetratricopeptide repeat-containing sulfotransferase family protein n=1 Tax=Microbulbifer sp. 2201CG32-9 TaxID=3232309 RepID=UPI00345C4733